MAASFDLSPYGIKATLTPDFDFAELRKPNKLEVGTRRSGPDGKPTAFILKRVEYKVIEKLGEGTYGAAYKVSAPDGKEYAIKFMTRKMNPEELEALVKESIINILVADASKEQPTGPYAPNLYELAYNPITKEGFIRSELLHNRFDNIVNAFGPVENDTVVPDAISQIASMLRFLFTTLRFNHRDLKGDNVMYAKSPDGKTRWYRFIDFGMSCITWNGLKISGSQWFDEKHSCFKTDRDLSQFIYFIVVYLGRRLSPKLLTHLQSMLVANVGGKHKCVMYKHCPLRGLKDWRTVYNFVDRPNVVIPNADPSIVLQEMNRFRRGEPYLGAPAPPKPIRAPKEPAAAKICPPGKVLNPKTGRCIKAKGSAPGLAPTGPAGLAVDPSLAAAAARPLRPALEDLFEPRPAALPMPPAPAKAKSEKPCSPGKIRNPKTRRCVKATGATARGITRKSRANGKEPCPPGKVLNPKTGRCVNAKGTTAKKAAHNEELLAALMARLRGEE